MKNGFKNLPILIIGVTALGMYAYVHSFGTDANPFAQFGIWAMGTTLGTIVAFAVYEVTRITNRVAEPTKDDSTNS